MRSLTKAWNEQCRTIFRQPKGVIDGLRGAGVLLMSEAEYLPTGDEKGEQTSPTNQHLPQRFTTFSASGPDYQCAGDLPRSMENQDWGNGEPWSIIGPFAAAGGSNSAAPLQWSFGGTASYMELGPEKDSRRRRILKLKCNIRPA
jgi:hypothetical protein